MADFHTRGIKTLFFPHDEFSQKRILRFLQGKNDLMHEYLQKQQKKKLKKRLKKSL